MLTTIVDMSELPAGWYRNPEGESQERYWDGTSWGELTRARGDQVKLPPPTIEALVEADAVPTAVSSGGELPISDHSEMGEGGHVQDSGRPGRKRRFPLWAKIAVPAGVIVIAGIVTGAAILVPIAEVASQKSQAVEACKTSALDQLKSPATAKFSRLAPSNFLDAFTEGKTDAQIAKMKAKAKPGYVAYIMSGSVDSQNSFGATVRSSVSCVVGFQDGRVIQPVNALLVEN